MRWRLCIRAESFNQLRRGCGNGLECEGGFGWCGGSGAAVPAAAKLGVIGMCGGSPPPRGESKGWMVEDGRQTTDEGRRAAGFG